jgi:hypothetical protein
MHPQPSTHPSGQPALPGYSPPGGDPPASDRIAVPVATPRPVTTPRGRTGLVIAIVMVVLVAGVAVLLVRWALS